MPSKILPASQTINWDRTGAVPSIEALSVIVVETQPIDYVQFYLIKISGNVDWLASPISGEYLDTSGGDIPLNFTNLDTLEAGNYQYKVDVIISNNDAFSTTKTAYINFNITGDPPVQILTDKEVYTVVFNRDDNTISGDLVIGILNNTEDVLLKFWQNDQIFAAAENFTDVFTLSENPANLLADNPILPETGIYSLASKILKQTGEFVRGFTIKIIVIDGGISVDPESLAFEIFKAPANEKTAILTVTNPLGIDFEITDFPDWITLSAVSGNSDLNITVTTVTASLPLGIYTENIVFEYDGETLEIPVTLDLKAFIQIDEMIDFCLDLPDALINRKTDDGKLVRITLSAKYNVLGVEYNFQKVYQSWYFKGVAAFALGEKLHRHFPRAKRHFFDETDLEFLQKINASIKVEELSANLGILFVETKSGIKLFPGKKPAAYPLLSTAIDRKKNENSILFTSKVVLDAVNLKKSDISILPSEISFYDFPKTFSPVHVQWENQNLCPDWFTFTGDYKITPDFNHIYARNIFNAQNEKYDVTKVKTLTINTGLFLGKERELMTEIIESKLSFLKIEGKIYRAFNITKKNVEVDSTEELIARDLEFIIVE